MSKLHEVLAIAAELVKRTMLVAPVELTSGKLQRKNLYIGEPYTKLYELSCR